AHHRAKSAAASKRATAGSGQRDLRKKLSLCDANFCIRGNQVLLRLKDMGPSRQQRGRQTRRHFWRNWLVGKPYSARDGPGIVAEKNADCVLFLAKLSLDIRDLRIRGVEHLPSLKHV